MRRLLPLAFLLIVPIALSACGGGGGTTRSSVSEEVSAAKGGELQLAGGARLIIPAGALKQDVTVTSTTIGVVPAAPYWGTSLGPAIQLDLGGETLSKPATLELHYTGALPATSDEGNMIVASYYDEVAGEWVPVAGAVDSDRQVVSIQITHASWWQPSSWLLDTVVQGIVTGFKLDWGGVVDAFAAFDGCVQSPSKVLIDESQLKDYLGTCVEVDDALHPRLRIVNRRTFHEKVYPVAGAVTTDLANPGLPLGRLERRSFNVDFSSADPSQSLVVRAEVDWPYTLGHAILDLISLLPGLSANTATGQRILVELYQDRDFIAAAAALSSGDDEAFKVALPKALARAAESYGELNGVDLRLILPVFRALGGAGISIQMIDAANSARVGSGEVRFSSTRPPPTPTPPPAAPTQPPPPPGLPPCPQPAVDARALSAVVDLASRLSVCRDKVVVIEIREVYWSYCWGVLPAETCAQAFFAVLVMRLRDSRNGTLYAYSTSCFGDYWSKGLRYLGAEDTLPEALPAASPGACAG